MSYGELETKEKKLIIYTFWPEYIYDISPNSAILQHNELQQLVDFSDEHQGKPGPLKIEN